MKIFPTTQINMILSTEEVKDLREYLSKSKLDEELELDHLNDFKDKIVNNIDHHIN